jgi:uncharacterized protein YceK
MAVKVVMWFTQAGLVSLETLVWSSFGIDKGLYMFQASRKLQTLALLTCTLLGGCASVVSGRFQQIHVTTYCESQRVESVCQVSNENGEWTMNAPGQLQIQKGFGDLVLFCRSEYFEPHMLRVSSSSNLGTYGNIVLGAGAGALVDVNNGAGYDYPSDIRFVVKSCKIPRKSTNYFGD